MGAWRFTRTATVLTVAEREKVIGADEIDATVEETLWSDFRVYFRAK